MGQASSRTGAMARFGRNLLVGGLVATSAVAATATTIAWQDISSLTGVTAESDSRWTMRLAAIPAGTNAAKAEDRVLVSSEFTLAVKDQDGVHTIPDLDVQQRREPAINRSLKGDRVVGIDPSRYNVAKAQTLLLKPGSIILSPAKTTHEPSPVVSSLLAAAQQFHSEEVGEDAGIVAVAQIESGIVRMKLPSGQLADARLAARQMARLQDRNLTNVRKAKNGATVSQKVESQLATARKAGAVSNEVTGSVVTAYAPQEQQGVSPFAAVLRSTLPKERPAQPKPIITLAKGDHKWALNKLPNNSTSAAQRRCLAIGVYFEARGEPVKGQRAVAQVILNRVKNPAYPNTICKVVYQNKHKRNRCQFSFACDGIKDRIKSPTHWEVARGVANDAIDGSVWLKTVGSSSHYHADYVWPRWRRSMKRLTKIGRHIFYRTYGGGWS